MPIQGDLRVESDETFSAYLSWPVNAFLGQGYAQGTILNDDGLPGRVDHFAWELIASSQHAEAPFEVAVTALDASNSTVENFVGPVSLSASIGGGATTNSILGDLEPTDSRYAYDWSYTEGYSFTPSTNLLVTHVRHYFGSKVSIWTELGVRLVSQAVTSTPGSWVETPLNPPLTLSAGSRYRVTVLCPSGMPFYYTYNKPAVFPHGVIESDYYFGNGDGFPTTPDPNAGRYLVDLRYTVGVTTTVAVAPTVSGVFVNGTWRGTARVIQVATNVVLQATDSEGHQGLSNPFVVGSQLGTLDHFEWGPIASPQYSGQPFAVTIQAKDAVGATVAGFNRAVEISASAVDSQAGDRILGDVAFSHTETVGPAYTEGYAFTPNTDLLVTHVRHLFGNKVSIWTDKGVLIAAQAVSSNPGQWVETPLNKPLLLASGVRYRVAIYFTGVTTLYLAATKSLSFDHGVIHGDFYALGDAFPTEAQLNRFLVDLRYTTVSSLPAAVEVRPGVSGEFLEGEWTGQLTLSGTANQLTLRADDRSGHVGLSPSFEVQSGTRLSISHSGASLLLSWPASSPGFVLQAVDGLTSPTRWVNVPAAVAGNQYISVIDTSNERRFYRLVQPR